MNYKTRIGYACMNMDHYPNDYKTCRKENITEDNLDALIRHNLEVLRLSLEYNIRMGNRMFRISSSLIPFGSSLLNTLDWESRFKEEFQELHHLIETHDIRISMHPGQYTVINSNDETVVKSSMAELEYHAKVMRLLSDDPSHKMILHVGGVYGDKDAAMKRFMDVYETRLSKAVKKHLVIENDDRLYTVEDVLELSKNIGIPVVFDNLHHAVNPSLETTPLDTILEAVVKTWRKEDGHPKMHYSQQAPNKRQGAHSESITIADFKKDYEHYEPFDVDIMLEVKDKNRSFVKVNAFLNPSQRVLEEEWARYKYWVMARSQHAYNALRILFRYKPVDVEAFYAVIDALYEEKPNVGVWTNAFQHVWGYFKDIASETEKKQYGRLISQLQEETIKPKRVERFLYRLTFKYDVTYLKESYFFSE